MTTGAASSDSSATSPAFNSSPFTAFDKVHVDALIREKQSDELKVFKRKDPVTSDFQHAAPPSLRKHLSREPREVKEALPNIMSVIKELAYNNFGILELFPPRDRSSLAFAVRGVCEMQHLVINEMEDKYYNGEDIDIDCVMEHAKTMHENSFKLIPLVGELPPVFCSKVKDLDQSIAKLRLWCFDRSSVKSRTALASSFENSEGAGSLA